MKKTISSRLLIGAIAINLIIAGAALAATDNVDNQTLVNAGALTVTYTPTEQFFGSTDADVLAGLDFADFTFTNLTFTNTTGVSNAFTLSATTTNFQASTGTAAAGTGFNYATMMQFLSDTNGTIAFTAGSVGSGNVALSNTGVAFNDTFQGSGASGSTSDSLDLLTGCGAAFSLEGAITPRMILDYNYQLPGLYTGTMTFTII